MEKVAISLFKARCLSMLEKVRRTGTPILITRRGEPIAEITAPSLEHGREDWLGSAAGGRVRSSATSSLLIGSKDWEVLGMNEAIAGHTASGSGACSNWPGS